MLKAIKCCPFVAVEMYMLLMDLTLQHSYALCGGLMSLTDVELSCNFELSFLDLVLVSVNCACFQSGEASGKKEEKEA